jgi:hypothetical protein
MTDDERKDHEEAEGEATVLPAREAMSLITPPSPATGFMPDLDSLPGTDAAASPSGDESVTAEDRHEVIESHDSASSET